MFVLLTKYYWGDQIRENEVGGSFGMDGEEERRMHGFGRNNLGKEGTWKT